MLTKSNLYERTQSFSQNLAYIMNKSKTTITGYVYSPAKEQLYGGVISRAIMVDMINV